jgi:uncharacterized repeat protein (TIGR03803 family)
MVLMRITSKPILFALAALIAMAPGANAQPLEILHTFTDTTSDGATPMGRLIQAPDGTFYGTTIGGGPEDSGSIFKITPDGTITFLHFFGDYVTGYFPTSRLLLANDGNFYGTASGGPRFGGTIFRMTPDGDTTILRSFDGYSADPHNMYGPLIQATDGYLYGTTENGGTPNRGTIFRMSLDGSSFAVLHEFTLLDGTIPMGGIVQATDGNFYGTTLNGGLVGCNGYGCGTLWRMTPAGVFTVMHRFAGGDADGNGGQTTLIQGRDGNLYGTTYLGGPWNGGTVFKMSLTGAYKVIHLFDALNEGDMPRELVHASDGFLYGTTGEGYGYGCGGWGCGTIFRMSPDGSLTTLHSFTGQDDGASPYAGLTEGTDGKLYGVSAYGSWSGVAFRLDPIVCRNTLTLNYSEGTLTLGFEIESKVPTTWNALAVTRLGVATLWSVPIPAVAPLGSVNVPIPGVPSLGPIGVFTSLSTPSQGVVCFDWKTVNTSSTP